MEIVESIKDIKFSTARKVAFVHRKVDWNDVGRNGITLVLFFSENKKFAIISFDGNNMVKDLRDDIIRHLSDRGYDAEVLTSDSHEVNRVIGGYNPIGRYTPKEEIIATIDDMLSEAEKKSADGKGGWSHIEHPVRIFGDDTITMVTTTINSIISSMKYAIIPAMAAYLATAILITSL